MGAALEEAQRHVVTQIDLMPDVVQGASTVFHAALQEKEFVATLARATLDGVLPELPGGYPSMRRLVQRFEAELEDRGIHGHHDPRVVVACLTSLTMGYALFGQFIRRGTGLDGGPADQVEAAIVEVLRDVSRSAFHE